jgi:hypothetical protein
MLPGFVAGHYGFEDVHIDTGPLTRFAGARLYNDVATGLDFEGKRVLCRDRPPVPYDLLSVDIGSTPNTGYVPGAAEHAIPVKPIDGFLPRFDAMLGRVLDRRGRARIALVGAGPGGVEMLLAVERRLRREVAAAGFGTDGLAFTLVSGGPDLLPSLPDGVRQRIRCILAERGNRAHDRSAGRAGRGRAASSSRQVRRSRRTRSCGRRRRRPRPGCGRPASRSTSAASCGWTSGSARSGAKMCSRRATCRRSGHGRSARPGSTRCGPGRCWPRTCAAP